MRTNIMTENIRNANLIIFRYKIVRLVLLIAVFVFIAESVMAQPLPPADPQGNPVPLAGNVLVLLAMISGFILLRFKKKKT